MKSVLSLFLGFCLISLNLSLFSYEKIENSIPLDFSDVEGFPGNWSLCPESIYLSLKHVRYRDKLRILEFGAGEGTRQLVHLLSKKNIPFEYHTFENDFRFLYNLDKVVTHYYYLPDVKINQSYIWDPLLKNYTLSDLPEFDLIIIDGPHGLARRRWYEKFKKFSKKDTIILIDDFHHFKEFGEELDRNFHYSTINEFNLNPTWPLINQGLEIMNPPYPTKTFKIVKVINTI